MAQDYFPCFDSYYQKIARLTDEEVGRLFRALMRFNKTGEREEIAGREAMAYDFISGDIESAAEAYEKRCEQNRINGAKRTKRTLANASERYQTLPNATERYRTLANGSEQDLKETEKEEKEKRTKKVKEVKEKENSHIKESVREKKTAFGEFGNVMLTETERAKLAEQFGESKANEAIEFLSGYIVEKKYKSESHYLAIRRWVFNALDERQAKQKTKVEYGSSGQIGDAELEAIARLMDG